MKKYFLTISAIILLALPSCQDKTELTAEQRAMIEKEVKDQFNIHISSISQLNFDLWAEFYSEESFISVLKHRFDCLPNYTAWMDTVRVSFSTRERHQTELLDVRVTALTSDLALLTQVGIWENWWKNGNYKKTKGFVTFLWKKEQNGWKIIHVNETGQPIEEKLVE